MSKAGAARAQQMWLARAKQLPADEDLPLYIAGFPETPEGCWADPDLHLAKMILSGRFDRTQPVTLTETMCI